MPNVIDSFTPEIRDMLYKKHASASDILRMVEEYKLTNKKEIKERLKEKIIANNSRLIFDICLKYGKKSSIDIKDLFQTGVIGILLALDKFDLKYNNNFSTYAVFWIKHLIKRSLKNESAIAVPRDFYLNYSKVNKILSFSENGQNENKLNESLRENRIDRQTFDRMLKETNRIQEIVNYLSLDSVISLENKNKETFTIFIKDERAEDALKTAEHNELINRVKIIVEKHLDDKERKVINTMFFSGEDDLHEVAKQVGMPYKTTLYFRDKAIKKIKKWMVKKNEYFKN